MAKPSHSKQPAKPAGSTIRMVAACDEIDGPLEPDGFVWRGFAYYGLRPTCWRLIKSLWFSASRAERIRDLALPVFELHEEPNRGQYAPAASRANQFFKWNALPFSIRARSRYLQLIEHPD
ncbi:MAG TPA: hypothetical protein VL175_12535 [Pirellulales bacterium]|jgi:hypothetical protein|nr:hypothetical protein [Pirellulales bacterium]